MSATQVNSGLEGVVAAETTISLVDGQAGRLLYRGYEIGDLAAHGSYDRVVGLLLDGEWPGEDEVLPAADAVSAGAGGPARTSDVLCPARRAAHRSVSAFGSERRMDWPPDPDQARELIALAPAVVGAFARIRDGREPVDPAGGAHLGIAGRLLHAISGEEPDPRQGARPGRLLHRLRRAWPERVHLHRPRDHVHAVRPGQRDLRRGRRAEGAAARRRSRRRCAIS